MKALVTILLAVIVLVVGIVILLAFLGIFSMKYPKEASESTTLTTTTPSNIYDYTTYLLDKNPINLNTYDECDNLKTALKYALLSGKPFKVDEIAYGNDLVTEIPFPFIGDCASGEILTDIAPGLQQKLCDYVPITMNLPDGVSVYGGISDAGNLNFEECFYDTSNLYALLTNDIGPEESFNPSPSGINLYYSPDYLYIRDGDYSHYPLINNIAAFYNAYNGPGRLKIYVGNAEVSPNGDCQFNIYFCPRAAIARSDDNSTIDIFNLFRNLELYELKVIPYYIRDLSYQGSDIPGFSKKIYYWNYYDVPLDGDYRVETIINAIKEGLYVNVRAKNYFWAHPHWDITRDASINKAGECWNGDYDDLLMSGSTTSRTRSIRFNCGVDNICSGTLRIKIAIRQDFRDDVDIDGDGTPDNLNYISGVISFCDQ
jgi:hypothetical protein